MIFETFDKPGFGEQDISGDRDQPADGECRTDGGRCGAGVSIDEQDRCIDDIADTDHSLNLPAPSRAARQRLGRQFATDTLRRIRRRIQKRRRSDTHKFAMVKAIGENVRGKAFRFGIFRAEILGRKGCFPLFARRNRPSEARQPRQASVGTRGSGRGKWRANCIGSDVFRYRRDIVLNGGYGSSVGRFPVSGSLLL